MRIQPYPDETIYSVCSRIHAMNGNSKLSATATRLFGNSEKTIHILWPNRLEFFSLITGIHQDTWINEHTPFPYYRHFLSDEKIGNIREVMYSGVKRSPSAFLGNNKNVPVLQLCPMCVNEDADKFGEPYWHRTHHLPGTKVCYKHKVHLLDRCPVCNLPFASNSKQLTITPAYCNNGHLLKSVPAIEDDLWRLALANRYLLTNNNNINVDMIREKLRYFARINGYLNVQSSMINYNRLTPHFNKRYTKDFIKQIGLNIDERHMREIQRIFWKRHLSSNPLHYLLLILYFTETINSFFSDTFSFNPFQQEPWPCLNALCTNYKTGVITTIELRNTNEFGRPRGVFKCMICGFAYSRLGPDQTEEDRFTYDLIIETGHVWNKRFDEILADKIFNFTYLTNELHVGDVFLKLRLKERYGETFAITKLKVEAGREIKRKKIIEIMAKNPGINKHEIRELEPKIIKWQEANDKEWLHNNTSQGRKILSLGARREKFLIIFKDSPGATRVQLRRKSPSIYSWLLKYDNEWIENYLPSKSDMYERRQVILLLIEYNPNITRNEMRIAESFTYNWLMKNDREWLHERLPPAITTRGVPVSVQVNKRRKIFLKLIEENKEISRNDLKRLDQNNYVWLQTNDSEWFNIHQPPPKARFGIHQQRLTCDQRRDLFKQVYDNNPNVMQNKLRNLCGSNYEWLRVNDYEWFQQFQPNCKRSK